jgi:transcriptional regulator with XRE-family HTH domain
MRGLGSRELSKLSGLSAAAVSRLETRKVHGIDVATLVQIADALGVRRAWLLTGEGEPDRGVRRDSSTKTISKKPENVVVSTETKDAS